MSKQDLVGKVIKWRHQALLITKELENDLVGYWLTRPPEYCGIDSLKIPKLPPTGPVEVIANNLEAYIRMSAARAKDRAEKRKYVGSVCLNENSVLGLVTSYEDGICHGITPSGFEWHCQNPDKVAASLCDYVEKKSNKLSRE